MRIPCGTFPWPQASGSSPALARDAGAVLAWDHNAAYQRLLLREVPRSRTGPRLGCGAGDLAARLAARVRHVEALDSDPTMIALARRRVPPNVECVVADVMQHPLSPASYDAVVSMSALHHLPLAPALERLAAALRPGGVFAAVALPHVDLPRELPVEAAGAAWHVLAGLGLAVAPRRVGQRLRTDPEHDLMPTRDPVLTTRQVRAQAASVLPGARVRRLLLWRYSLVWRRPVEDC